MEKYATFTIPSACTQSNPSRRRVMNNRNKTATNHRACVKQNEERSKDSSKIRHSHSRPSRNRNIYIHTFTRYHSKRSQTRQQQHHMRYAWYGHAMRDFWLRSSLFSLHNSSTACSRLNTLTASLTVKEMQIKLMKYFHTLVVLADTKPLPTTYLSRCKTDPDR